MEIKTGISLQTKQQLSQLQVESLNILAMSMTELKDFLQNEEIENPLVEYTSGKEEAAPITYKETERFYNGTDRDERRENELYEIEDSEKSLEDLVNTQLQWEQIGPSFSSCLWSFFRCSSCILPALRRCRHNGCY